MPSPASSEPRLRATAAPFVGADPASDRDPWTAVWRPAPEARPDVGAARPVPAVPGRLVWAGPTTQAPRDLLAEAARADRPGPRAHTRISPLLMDHHVHGGDGTDLATSPTADIRAWLARQRAAGVGTVLGSLPALGVDDLAAALYRLRPLWAEGALAGVHLEGPFLSPARAGAQHPDALCAPDSEAGHAVRALLAAQPTGFVRTMTLAPELPGAGALASELSGAGTVPCLGHSDVDLPGADAALALWTGPASRARPDGLRPGRAAPTPVVTHLFNAMRPFHHRDPGPLPALLAAARAGRARLEVIADGVHLDAGVLRLMLEDPVLAPRLCLVSDAVAGTGAPVGSEHRLGPGTTLHTADDAPRLGAAPPRGCPAADALPGLAGGAVTLADAVRRLLGAGLSDAASDAVLRSATHVPRETLGGDGRSEAEAGVVLWDGDGAPTVLLPASC